MNIGAEPCWEGGRRIGTYDLGDNHAVVLAIAHVAATVGAGRRGTVDDGRQIG